MAKLFLTSSSFMHGCNHKSIVGEDRD